MQSWIKKAGDLKFAQDNGAIYHEYLQFLFSIDCAKKGIPFYNARYTAPFTGKFCDIENFICANGYREFSNYVSLKDEFIDKTYTAPTGSIRLCEGTSSNELTIEFTTSDLTFVNALLKLYKANISDKKSNGKVFVLANTQHGPVFQPVGLAASSLVKENYHEKVISNVEHIVEDLNSDNPCGHISIFSGPPGTGKTYLIRSIVDLVPNSMFVVVAPEMVQEICKPNFIQAVISNRQTYVNNSASMVLLLEDADQILAPRGSDNMADISAMLNISDGILGKILNIRILATTNAKQQEFESAALRAGRLCRHIYLGELDQEHCQKVIARLGASKETLMANKYNPDKKYILADLYKMSRQDTAEESAQEKLPLGFNK